MSHGLSHLRLVTYFHLKSFAEPTFYLCSSTAFHYVVNWTFSALWNWWDWCIYTLVQKLYREVAANLPTGKFHFLVWKALGSCWKEKLTWFESWACSLIFTSSIRTDITGITSLFQGLVWVLAVSGFDPIFATDLLNDWRVSFLICFLHCEYSTKQYWDVVVNVAEFFLPRVIVRVESWENKYTKISV